MGRWFQYVSANGGTSPKYHPGLKDLVFPGKPFKVPEDSLVVGPEDFEQSMCFVETPDGNALTGAELAAAISAKHRAWQAWSKKDVDLARAGTPWNERPAFEYRPEEPKAKSGRANKTKEVNQ